MAPQHDFNATRTRNHLPCLILHLLLVAQGDVLALVILEFGRHGLCRLPN
jgi:hypothetical protein